MNLPAPAHALVNIARVGLRLAHRLIIPTRKGGWPRIPAATHRLAASIWLRFLTSNQYFGRTRLYQSFEPLALPGLRPTHTRARIYRLDALIGPHSRVLDIGCNMGCMTLEAARRAREAVGIDVDEDLLWIAETLRKYSGQHNVKLLRIPFSQFHDPQGLDVIFAFAVHRWVGMPFDDFVEKIRGLLKPDGVLVFESNNYRMVGGEFEAELTKLLATGFTLIDSGMTEFETLRKFCTLRKSTPPAATPRGA